MLNKNDFKLALQYSSPIFFGYISIGIPFGLVVTNAGYPWWIAPLMSIFIYSGTAQYIGVALFASGISKGEVFWQSLLTIIGIELVIGIRHSFYSFSLLNKFKGCGKWKFPLIFTITDETYAVLESCNVPETAGKGAFFGTISILDYLYWIGGTVAGALIGNFIPSGYLDGVDFALTALFAVIMISQLKATKDFLPSVAGILTTVFAIVLSYLKIGERTLLPPQHVILVGLSLGIAVMILLRGFKTEVSKSSRTSAEKSEKSSKEE